MWRILSILLVTMTMINDGYGEERKHEQKTSSITLIADLNFHEWKDDHRKALTIGVMLPGGPQLRPDKSLQQVFEFMEEAVHQTSPLENYKLQFHAVNVSKEDNGFNSILRFMQINRGLIGIVGPAWYSQVGLTAGFSNWAHIMVTTYSVDGEDFQHVNKYFFRTIGSNKPYNYIYSTFLEHFDWRRVAILPIDATSDIILKLQTTLSDHNISVVSNSIIPIAQDIEGMKKYLSDLIGNKVRIIIVDVFLVSTFVVICAAFHLKMTARQGYVWFLPEWLPDYWWREDQGNVESPCTPDELYEVINGHFRIQQTYFGSDNQTMQGNQTIDQWRKRYDQVTQGAPLSKHAGFFYDACWTYIYAAQRFMLRFPTGMDTIHEETSAMQFRNIIAESDFYGLSGRVRFNGGPSRVMDYKVEQFVNNSYRTIANFYPNASDLGDSTKDGKFTMDASAIVWLSGSIPNDGRDSPTHCVFGNFAKALHVSCEISIVIVFAMIFILLGIVFGIGTFVFKRKYDQKVRMREEFLKAQGTLRSDDCGLDEWEIPRYNIVLNRRIGEGAFGVVYGGEVLLSDRDWCPVAVKTLKVGSSTEDKCDFFGEVEVMKRFDHPNIIQLLGVCMKSEPALTVMEFMLYGDLRGYLLARKHLVKNQGCETSDEIGFRRLTEMALDVTRALNYLQQLKYVHRDVASRNCLVNAERVVKLGDFGLTRSIFDKDYYRFSQKGKFPVRWMAPEFLDSGVYTPQCDIWSFGILLFEIITFGGTPFKGMTNDQVFEHVRSGNSLPIPEDVKPTLRDLMSSCLAVDQLERPTPLEITAVLVSNPCLLEPCLNIAPPNPAEELDFEIPEKHRPFSVLIPSNRETELSNPLLIDERIDPISPDDSGIELIKLPNITEIT